jgi:hypothetical protein
MLKMLMKPINDVEGNALRDSDDNDDDEVSHDARNNDARHNFSYTASHLTVMPGIAVTNGREPKSCLGRVFNSKIGHIAALLSNCLARMQQPLLELKTRPRVRPVSQSLSMVMLSIIALLMLSVIILSINMLKIMLGAVMISVVLMYVVALR